MTSKFSRALSQRYENGPTCSAYKCVYGQLQSRAPSTLLGLLPPILLIPHATRPSLRRSVCLRMGGRNSEERVRQARRQVTIRSTMKALKYPETEERRLLFRWDDSAVRSVVLWKWNPTLRNTDMTLKNSDICETLYCPYYPRREVLGCYRSLRGKTYVDYALAGVDAMSKILPNSHSLA